MAYGTNDGAAYDLVEPVSGDPAELRQRSGRLQRFHVVAGLWPIGGVVPLAAEESVAGDGRAQGPEYAVALQVKKVDDQQQHLISAGQCFADRGVIEVTLTSDAALACSADLVRLTYEH